MELQTKKYHRNFEIVCEVHLKRKYQWDIVMLCTIWYHLYNLKDVETPMKEGNFL